MEMISIEQDTANDDLNDTNDTQDLSTLETCEDEKSTPAGSLLDQKIIGVYMFNGNDQGRQPTYLGMAVISAAFLDKCVDSLRPVLSNQLAALPNKYAFCTKQGWPVTAALENSIMVRSILTEDGHIGIQPSYEKPKVGIKSKCGNAFGFVFIEYSSSLSHVRQKIQQQVLNSGSYKNDFVFLDPNDWPVTTDQEASLSVFDVIHGNCLVISVTTTSASLVMSEMNSPELEPPCKRPRLQGPSPQSFRSVKDSSRCLALESPHNNTHASKQILISYVRAEAAQHAVDLKNQLSALGCSVYLDVDEIQSGVDWQDSLNYAVSNCELFLPLVTPVYGETQWTNREVKLADVLGKFILPISFLEEWPPRCLAIQFATTQYIAWKTPTQIQTELAEGRGQAVYDFRFWDKKYIASVAAKVADRVRSGWQSSRIPSLVKRKTIVKSCAMVSQSNSQAITSNRDGLPLIVICLHPLQQEQGILIKNWLEKQGYEVWLSTELTISYPDSLPKSPTVRFSQSSFCEEEKSNNEVFQEMADDAGMILAILSKEFGASRTCQQQVYYCEHRKRMVSVTTEDRDVEFPLWVNKLMGKDTWLNVKQEHFQEAVLKRIKSCFDPRVVDNQQAIDKDAKITQRIHSFRSKIHTTFCVCVVPGKLLEPKSCDIYRSVLSHLTSVADVTLVTCLSHCHGNSKIIENLQKQYKVLTDSHDIQDKVICDTDKVQELDSTAKDWHVVMAGLCNMCVLVYGDHSMEQLVQEFLWKDHTVIPVHCSKLNGKLARIHQVPPGLCQSDWSMLDDHTLSSDVVGSAVKTVIQTLLTQKKAPHQMLSPSTKRSPFKTPSLKGNSPQGQTGQKAVLSSQQTVLL